MEKGSGLNMTKTIELALGVEAEVIDVEVHQLEVKSRLLTISDDEWNEVRIVVDKPAELSKKLHELADAVLEQEPHEVILEGPGILPIRVAPEATVRLGRDRVKEGSTDVSLSYEGPSKVTYKLEELRGFAHKFRKVARVMDWMAQKLSGE